MQLSKQEKLLFLVPCCVLGLPLFAHTGLVEKAISHLDFRGDGLDKAIRQAAESGAKDCGHVPMGGSRTAADACTVAALKGNVPFYTRYDTEGTDSLCAEALVGTADGRVRRFTYDSDPSGGSHSGERVDESACAKATIVVSAGVRHIECR